MRYTSIKRHLRGKCFLWRRLLLIAVLMAGLSLAFVGQGHVTFAIPSMHTIVGGGHAEGGGHAVGGGHAESGSHAQGSGYDGG